MKLVFLPLFIFLWLIMKLGSFTNFMIISAISFLKKFFLSLGVFAVKRFLLFKKIPRPTIFLTLKLNLGLVIITLIAIYSYSLINIALSLPNPERLKGQISPMTTEIYDRGGNLLYRFYEGKNRSPIKLEELPPHLIQATIAIEDKNFYRHPGIDLTALARVVVHYFQTKQLQGGSTITQQLIKNTLLSPERSFKRKAKEIIVSLWAERKFTKDQILEMYFNEVPYGGPTWGIAASARTYFGKEVKGLNLSESAYLAGLPASPTTFSPHGSNPELAKMRQKEVLKKMVREGYITASQAEQASNQPLNIIPPDEPIKAAHFVMYAKEVLVKRFGERLVNQGGLKIYTTLDLHLQQQVEEIVEKEVNALKPLWVKNGAAMVMDAKTGHILAMVRSKNYFDADEGNFNVTLANRQPGSSIKPITYASAFKEGFSPANLVLDTPVSFKDGPEVYRPQNYDGRFHGVITFRTALASSYNIPAVKILSTIGKEKMLQTAKDLGITTFNDPTRYGLSITLGGAEVKMIDMMSVYGAFSQLGMRHEPQPILKVIDASGSVIEDNTDRLASRVLDDGIAYLVTDILIDNSARSSAFGPNSLLRIPNKTVAVKTGTTDSKRDNWTFGYTPEFVVGTWVGNNDYSPMHPSLTSGITGAAPIWNKIMNLVLLDRPDIKFRRPANVEMAMVDGKRDLVLKGVSLKSMVGIAHKIRPPKLKEDEDDKDKKEKEVITFTDPFSSYEFQPVSP